MLLIRLPFTNGSRLGNRLVTGENLSGRTVRHMFNSLLSLARLGPSEVKEYCWVCLKPVRRGEEHISVPGGGQVHRGCTTYRMRHHRQVVRRVRAG